MNAPIVTCPDLGAWRVWLDEPGGDLDTHLAGCDACRALVSDLRQNAALAAALIRPLAPETLPSPAAVELARARLRVARAGSWAAMPQPQRSAPAPVSRFRRWRTAMAGMAAALALMAFVATPQGRGVAAQFINQFRSERLEAVPINVMQLDDIEQTFNELANVGTVTGVEAQGDVATVSSLAEAEQRAGFPVQAPDPGSMPAGFPAAPTEINVTPSATLRFTFDGAKARAYYQSTGRPNVELPDRFDGASIVVRVPSAVVLQYGQTTGSGAVGMAVPMLVGQAGLLTVDVEGNVTLDEMRDFLLDLPGLPPETVQQLRAIQDWQTTLPIPVPVDLVDWQGTTVDGAPGLLFSDKLGLGSAVVWQRDDRIYAVGGLRSAGDIQRVAEGFR